jgi:Holliday junction DNA helicase RuvA
MIAGLEGKVSALGPDYAVLNVGGVFYRVAMPGSLVGGIGKIGDTARLHTYLYVREDQLALYGAPEERQIRLFETLLGVSGIGPKAALAIMGTMPVDALEGAIASGNIELLTKIPGIGRKSAARLVLELKGKIDSNTLAGATPVTVATGEVVEALSSLGYNPAEIQAALSALPKDSELATEDMIMFALKRLGR